MRINQKYTKFKKFKEDKAKLKPKTFEYLLNIIYIFIIKILLNKSLLKGKNISKTSYLFKQIKNPIIIIKSTNDFV